MLKTELFWASSWPGKWQMLLCFLKNLKNPRVLLWMCCSIPGCLGEPASLLENVRIHFLSYLRWTCIHTHIHSEMVTTVKQITIAIISQLPFFVVAASLKNIFSPFLFLPFLSPPFFPSPRLPSFMFFLSLFYDDKPSWSLICNSNSPSMTSYNIHWNFQPGVKSVEVVYVLTEWHMEIWCLDTFSQQQSKVLIQEFFTLSNWLSNAGMIRKEAGMVR